MTGHDHIDTLKAAADPLRVAAAVANISTVALHAIHDYDEPLLAALGFAVAYLQAHPFQAEPPPKRGPYDPWAVLKSDYNPL